MKPRLQFSLAATRPAFTRLAKIPFAMALGTALLLSGCMTDVEDEWADETDDLGYAHHDLGAELPSDEGEGEGKGVEARAKLPTAGSSVDVPDEQFDESLFEPQPQPWDGEEGMQESDDGEHQGGE